jgi:molybdate transport system substrate-binding protein
MNRFWPLLLAFALGACASEERLVVFCASSMQDAASAIAGVAGVSPSITPGGSDLLAFQISQGARADVLVTADLDAMTIAGKAKEAKPFATAELAVGTKPDGPVKVFTDLAKPGVRIAAASKDVPAGRYAQAALEKLGAKLAGAIRANIVTEEPSVRSALQKLMLGEVDAAFVYNTDLRATELERIAVPPEAHQRATYYIVALSPEGDGYVAAARTPEGRKVLDDLGFGKP